jgi:hypothetical protein
MSDEPKLTQSEFAEIFGKTIPMEAIDLVFNGPADMTIGEVRKKLRSMGKEHQRLRATADAIEDRIGRYITPSARQELDWPWIFSDAARVALEAADAILGPGGVPFDDSARLALAEISSIAFDMKQTPEGEHFATPPRLAFARIFNLADLLLKFVDKARAGS